MLVSKILRYGNLKNDLSSSEKKIVIEHLLDYSTKLVKIFHEPIVDESPEGLLLMGSVGNYICSSYFAINDNHVKQSIIRFFKFLART